MGVISSMNFECEFEVFLVCCVTRNFLEKISADPTHC